MVLDDVSAWLVWVLPLISSLFVPLIAKYSDKARNYFVVAISVITVGFGAFTGARRLLRDGSSHRHFGCLDCRHQRWSLH